MPFRIFFFCGCLVFAPALHAAAPAELIPSGSEYGVTPGAIGDQMHPNVAVSDQGGYLVWEDNSVTSLGSRIVAKRIGDGWSLTGVPFPVSSAKKSKIAGDQARPQVALLKDGGAVVVWQGGKPALQQIYARFIRPDGVLAKADIRVGKHVKNNQLNPSVAVLSDGSVIVVWASVGQDGSRQGIFGQRLTATGGKLGAEFQVNQFTLNNQRNPSVAAVGDGFVIVWVSELQRNPFGSVDIFGRHYSGAGVPLSNEFAISTTTNQACANPVIAGLPGAGFAVAWTQKEDVGGVMDGPAQPASVGLTSSSWDVYSRLFDTNASPILEPFRINETEYGDQYVPKIAAMETGYVAIWTSLGQDGSREGIYGRAFASNGDFAEAEFRVNTTTRSRQVHPSIASDGTNKCIAVWSSIMIGSGFDLFAQSYLHPSGE